MDLSITIASYNSINVTRDALRSLFAETRDIAFEVIVVDNASKDGSPEMIQKEFPEVRLIRSDTNLGFAAAHNLALLQARGDFLLVLNSDVLFLDNACKRMVDRLRDSGPEFGALGPQILNPDRSPAPSSRRRLFYSKTMVGLSAVNQFFPYGEMLPMDFLRKRFKRVLGRVHDNFDLPTAVETVEWVDGMCVLLRREALEDAGLFDEQFFFDFEIGDLLLRVREKGWKIVFDPTILIVHLGGYTRKRVPRIMPISKRSQFIYFAKHRPEYVPMMRSLFIRLITLKRALLRLRLLLPVKQPDIREHVEILGETLKIVRGFEVASVRENEKVPVLPAQPNIAPFSRNGRAEGATMSPVAPS